MAIRNLLLLILIVGSLVIFVLENMTPVVPLIILGTQTQAFPLAIWLLAAIAAGAVTMLFIAGLIWLASVSSRSRPSRFSNDRPQYRPASVESFDDDDDDWEVIDVDGEKPNRPSDNGGDRTESRQSRFSSDRYPTDESFQDFQPSESRSNWVNRGNANAGDRRSTSSSSNSSSSSRSKSSGSAASPLEDWDRFTTPRTEWDQWNAYEEAPASFSERNQVEGDRPAANQYAPEPETVIQDRVDRDWQSWKDHREEPGNTRELNNREFKDDYRSSRDDANGGYDNDDGEYDDAYDDDYDDYDAIDPQRSSEAAGNRDYDDRMTDEVGDRDYDDRINDAAEDSTYGSEWATYSTSTDSSEYTRADEGYDAIGYDDAGDYDAGDYGAEDYDARGYDAGGYDASDYQDAPDYGGTDDYEDVSERDSSRWDTDPSPGDAFYTVRYTEEDDYYDDYDDYVTDSGRSPQSSGDRPSEPQSDPSTASIDDDLADFEDWEEEPQPPSDQTPQTETSEKPGRIYEVPQRPASVRQSGTVYSYRYRPSAEDENSDNQADNSTDSQLESSPLEAENPSPSKERAEENDASNQETQPHQGASPPASPESSEPDILTTPPPTDHSGSSPPPDQTS